MKVNKDIDIKMLKDMLGNMIEICKTSLKPKVELDYNTAIRIYDVLEETQTREERHQTLESARTFIEMEDGTQTNEIVPDCYGCYIDKSLDCNNCKIKESCLEDTMKIKEEDDDFI